jgi:hypothetical protein
MTWRRFIGLGLLGVAAVALLLWVARARLAAELAREYFRSHGVQSSVDIDGLGLAGVSGRFALGPAGAPEVSAERVELRFDPLRWMPRVAEVRLVNPMLHARLGEDGAVTLPSLQQWIDSLQASQGKSRFVSDDLAVSLTGLRAFLASPYGALELDGDVKLVRNLPVSATLVLRPAAITYRQFAATVKSARLDFNQQRAVIHVSGDLRSPGLVLDGLNGELSAEGLRWSLASGGFSVAALSLRMTLAARTAAAGVVATKASLAVTAQNLAASAAQGAIRGSADIQLSGGADFMPEKIRALLSADRTLANAAAANLAHLDLAAQGHVESRDNRLRLSLSAPATLRGAGGAVLQVSDLALQGAVPDGKGSLNATLTGKGLPALTLAMPDFTWSDQGFQGRLRLGARFDYAMLHGATAAAEGSVTRKAGVWAFSAASCTRLRLAAFRPGKTDMATDVSTAVCPSGKEPLISMDAGALKLRALLRDAAANLPLANVRMEKAGGALNFESVAGATLHGAVTLATAQVKDGAAPVRFNPVMGSGAINLKDGIWQGKLAVASGEKAPLADVTFRHVMVSGAGTAHIAAPHLIFVTGKLQPETLSPLLAPFRHADGAVDFSGDVAWDGRGIASGGRLAIDSLDFLTPLGKAHAVKTALDFTSLLPPTTKAGQDLTISRIDWTLPFSGVDMRFGFSPAVIQVDKVSSGFAEGHVSLGAFAIDMANPKRIDGAADISSISLAALIAASNLGSKVKLEGKVSGHVPFSAGPDGFRIVNGHLQADGAGRLSIDRSLWAQGADAALSTNAVQDFAYQALENLSFDQLSADLNSVPGGRLQVVFHIKGRSDPPKPQQAEVGLIELLNGTALQKPIPLPSGTPIDLTLDTSLNFDELLKSYADAWSRTLSPGQAN